MPAEQLKDRSEKPRIKARSRIDKPPAYYCEYIVGNLIKYGEDADTHMEAYKNYQDNPKVVALAY